MSIQIIQKRQKRGAIRAATGSIREPTNKTNIAWQKQECVQAAMMLGDPGRKGTQGPSALSYSLDFERTVEELDRRKN